MIVADKGMKQLIIFIKCTPTGLLFIYFVLFQQFAVFSGIRTWIVGVEGDYAIHLITTITTAIIDTLISFILLCYHVQKISPKYFFTIHNLKFSAAFSAKIFLIRLSCFNR